MTEGCDIRVELTRDDLAQVRVFVEQMKQAKPNVRRTEVTPEQRDVIEVAGKLGEVVFGRCFGYLVDWRVHAGGDGHDFQLWDGSTVDVKSVAVEVNMDYDYSVPVGPGEAIASYLVQVLIAPSQDYGVITGAVSRQRFEAFAIKEAGWAHRGEVQPFVVRRAQLGRLYPPAFWAWMDPGEVTVMTCGDRRHVDGGTVLVCTQARGHSGHHGVSQGLLPPFVQWGEVVLCPEPASEPRGRSARVRRPYQTFAMWKARQ